MTQMGTHGLESSNFLVSIRVEVLLDVVDGHAARQGPKQRVGILRDAMIRAVARLEVHNGGPIVGEVLGEAACRA